MDDGRGDAEPRTSLGELAGLFLRLGTTAFGGPAAHIAMMREEVVLRRRWLSETEFLDLLGAANLIPGPTSTELAIHVGWRRRRWSGLLVAGSCFILPAMVITGALGWVYVRFGGLPQIGWVLYGLKPVVLAVIVQAIASLAPKAAPSWPLRALGLAAVVAVTLGADELTVLLAAGALGAALKGAEGGQPRLHGLAPLAVGAGASATAATLPAIFLVFAKIGAVLFGSGYVLLAFLRAELVERNHWLSESQLIDAVAVGQVTPGPLFTTATFVGYLLAGPAGAVVATVGIFLPAFVFVALSGPLVPRLRRSRLASGFLDGVNVASLALMVVVTAQIARAAIVDLPTAALGLLAAVLLIGVGLRSSWLLLGGALAGVLVRVLG